MFDFSPLVNTALDTSLFGTPVTYTPPGGTAVSVAGAGWVDEVPSEEDRQEGRIAFRRAKCVLRTADVAAPLRLAVVARAGEEWTVERVRPLATVAHELSLVLAAISEHAPNYRTTG